MKKKGILMNAPIFFAPRDPNTFYVKLAVLGRRLNDLQRKLVGSRLGDATAFLFLFNQNCFASSLASLSAAAQPQQLTAQLAL